MLAKIKWILYSSHAGTAVVTVLIVIWPLYINEAANSFILYTALAYVTSTMIGFLINDIYDISRDQINKAYRPLASGLIERKTVVYCCVALGILFIVALVNLFSYSIDAIYILVYFAIYILYNYVNKISGLLKNVTIACGFVMPYLFITCQLDVMEKNLFILIATFFFFLYRELLMDINDREGDRQTGLLTIPARVKDRTARFIVAVYWLIAVIFLMIHTFTFMHNLLKISICFSIILISAAQNCIWNNFRFAGKKMRILLISMWIPMSLSVFLIII